MTLVRAGSRPDLNVCQPRRHLVTTPPRGLGRRLRRDDLPGLDSVGPCVCRLEALESHVACATWPEISCRHQTWKTETMETGMTRWSHRPTIDVDDPATWHHCRRISLVYAQPDEQEAQLPRR